PTELATFADWDWVLGVNLGGVVNGIVTVLPRIMRHGEGGHIVNTASMSGLVPHPGATLYGTSKGAVVAMIECMRAELEPHGIICSAFCPGAVQSNIAEAGKTRPASLADTGYTETDKRRQQAGNFFHLFRTKEEVGQRVLEGILNDELYILTHSEFRQGVEDRAQAMCAILDTLAELAVGQDVELVVQYPLEHPLADLFLGAEQMKEVAGLLAALVGLGIARIGE